MEITTLFLVLSIGFYVLLFWRSQMQSKKVELQNRRRVNQSTHPRRRVSDRGDLENLVLNHLFEDEDTDRRPTTSH